MKNSKIYLILFLSFFLVLKSQANKILIYMDETQTNHLKAYGITYWVLEQEDVAEWLLNYRGGSFLIPQNEKYENELIIRGISYTVISEATRQNIIREISSPSSNSDVVKLEKKPKIAVYSPKNKQPWDDAVTLVLNYAEIPYDVVFDDEIMGDELVGYDWLHLHHEDFTGQYGKFYANYSQQPWYIMQKKEYEASAKKHGFNKVSKLKLAIAKKIQAYVASGGFLFAMCSATDTIDIALAAEGTDICDYMYDGDPKDPDAQSKLNYDNTFAFKDFILERNPLTYEYSNIDDSYAERKVKEGSDYFKLFEYSAKWSPIPTMLTQNHVRLIKGFYGQTTGFKKNLIRSDVEIMGDFSDINEARYIHGVLNKGFWTFYAGHDPEDYQHMVGEEPTDLKLHPNSPGYRLILNNILFPAAKKKKRKT